MSDPAGLVDAVAAELRDADPTVRAMGLHLAQIATTGSATAQVSATRALAEFLATQREARGL